MASSPDDSTGGSGTGSVPPGRSPGRGCVPRDGPRPRSRRAAATTTGAGRRANCPWAWLPPARLAAGLPSAASRRRARASPSCLSPASAEAHADDSAAAPSRGPCH
jgi:hypothetical protein